jgi:hypothetical protein
VKGLQAEICFSHFTPEGIEIFLANSKPTPSFLGALAADKGALKLS